MDSKNEGRKKVPKKCSPRALKDVMNTNFYSYFALVNKISGKGKVGKSVREIVCTYRRNMKFYQNTS